MTRRYCSTCDRVEAADWDRLGELVLDRSRTCDRSRWTAGRSWNRAEHHPPDSRFDFEGLARHLLFAVFHLIEKKYP
jgi:hypothetical protein